MSIDTFDLMKIQKLMENMTLPLKAEIEKLKSINVDLATSITDKIKSCTDYEFDDPENAKLIYSVQDHANKKYVRNPNVWIKGVDLTCISPWNSAGGKNRAGTAITKRHVLYASHYQIPANHTIRFITNDNEVVDRKIVNVQPLTGTDFTVGTLDSDLPDSITPAKILPPDWAKYFGKDNNPRYGASAHMLTPRVPSLCLDQEEKALIADCYSVVGPEISFTKPSDVSMVQFSENIIVGDSGNPAFFIIDNQLVLLTVWTYGGWGRGNFISGIRYDTTSQNTKTIINEIQGLISSSGAGGYYMLTLIDLWKYRTL